MIEIMVVVAIIGLMMGAVTLTVRNVGRSRLRSAASRTAATLRFAFDRATMTGNYLRLVLDLDKGEIWLEISEDRVSLGKGREQHHTTDERDVEAKSSGTRRPTPLLFGADDEDDEAAFGIDKQELKRLYERDLAPVARPKALFKPLKKKKRARRRAMTVRTVL